MTRGASSAPRGQATRRLALTALLLVSAGPPGDETLAPGASLTFPLSLEAGDPKPFRGLGPARIFTCTPEVDGPLTVTAESCHGDVVLRRVDAQDAVLEEDDNGLFGTNARLVLAARAGQPLRIAVAFAKGAGEVTVRLAAGNVPAPQGRERALREAEFRECHVQSSGLLETEPARACGELLLAAGAYYDAGMRARARAPLQLAAELAAASGQAVAGLCARYYLAAIERQDGDARTALPTLRALRDEIDAAPVPGLRVAIRSQLGLALLDAGQPDAARASLDEALELARATGDAVNEAIITSDLSRVAAQQSRPEEARAAAARAVELARPLGPGGPLAVALLQQGTSLVVRGEPLAAEVPLREALPLAVTADVRGRILGSLASVQRALGDHSGALRQYDQALAIGRELGEARLQAQALTGIGIVHRDLGQLDEAEAALRDALALFPPTGSATERTMARLQLAFVLGETGDFTARLAGCEEAREDATAMQDALARTRAELALSLHFEAAGELDKALAHAVAMEAIAREAGLPRELGDALASQAWLELRLGSLVDARRLAASALDVLRPLAVPERLIGPLTTQAQAALAAGDEAAAAAALAEAETIYDRPDLGLDPEQHSGLRRAPSVAACGALVQDLAALRWKRAGTDAERRLIADAGLRSAGRWKGRALLEGLLLRRDAPADRLGELSAGADGRLLLADTPGPTREQLAAILGPDGVLIEYVEGTERLYAWSLHGGEIQLHDLGTRAALGLQVEDFLAGVARPGHQAAVKRVAADGHALHEALLAAPLANVAPDAELFIVPSALVAALPFEALVVEAAPAPRSFADVTFVLDRREVLYAPSVPVLGLLAQAGPRAAPGRALVLADPLYEVPGAAATPRGPRAAHAPLQRLLGTRDEALDVAQALVDLQAGEPAPRLAKPTTDDFVLDTPQFLLRLGGLAAPDALADDPASFALIHCAAHGWMDPTDPRRTGLALTPHGDDDGFLSVLDVLGLRLDADLCVLSACETSRGGERRGEGPQSLTRAFLYAGARSVISSLWQVDDRETQQLMKGLYAGLGPGRLTASEALRAARLELRHGKAAPDSFRGLGRGILLEEPKLPRGELIGHPFFWAAFVYVGPPARNPLASLVAR